MDYLSKVSPEWKDRVGAATTVSWPGGIGGQGNPGVAGEVRQNPNSLGYVELAYAVQNRLGVGLVQNKAGAYPEPTFTAVSAAAAGALPTMPDDLRVSITDAEGEQSWPISTFTWILAYRQQRDRAKGQTLANYLFWAITEGQKFAPDLFYAPLPPAILPLVYSKIASLNFNGQPLLNAGSVLRPRPPGGGQHGRQRGRDGHHHLLGRDERDVPAGLSGQPERRAPVSLTRRRLTAGALTLTPAILAACRPAGPGPSAAAPAAGAPPAGPPRRRPASRVRWRSPTGSRSKGPATTPR